MKKSDKLVDELNALFSKYNVKKVVLSSDPEGNDLRLLQSVELTPSGTVCLWPGQLVSYSEL